MLSRILHGTALVYLLRNTKKQFDTAGIPFPLLLFVYSASMHAHTHGHGCLPHISFLVFTTCMHVGFCALREGGLLELTHVKGGGIWVLHTHIHSW